MGVKVENELNKDMVPVSTTLEDETEELQTFENKEANNQANKTGTAEMVPAPEQTVSDPDDKPKDDINQYINDSKTAIIRGKPKLSKPAPPVVAVKMADLQRDVSDIDVSDIDESNKGQSLEDLKASKPPAVDKKLIKQLERK